LLWLSTTLHLVLTVLLGIDVWSAEPLTMDSFLRAPLQSVELVFGKVAVGRGHTQDRSIGLSEFSSGTLCEEFRSICEPIWHAEQEGGKDQSKYRVTTMEDWVDQGTWKGVFTPREAQRLPLIDPSLKHQKYS
jgi:hypothetical protein